MAKKPVKEKSTFLCMTPSCIFLKRSGDYCDVCARDRKVWMHFFDLVKKEKIEAQRKALDSVPWKLNIKFQG